MRLFVAVCFNDKVKDYLSAAIRELKRAEVKGNFTHRENLHLTLVFLGELNSDQAETVKSVMNRIEGKPFSLAVSGFGRFNRNGGDIHWASVDKSEALFALQKDLASELKKEGFSLEDRSYSPHLTLGRGIRLANPTGNPYAALMEEMPKMTVARISLMKSERVDGRLVYSEIYGRDLT